MDYLGLEMDYFRLQFHLFRLKVDCPWMKVAYSELHVDYWGLQLDFLVLHWIVLDFFRLQSGLIRIISELSGITTLFPNFTLSGLLQITSDLAR